MGEVGGRWLVASTDAHLWLIEVDGAEAIGRTITRDELARSYPALHASLARARCRDTPFILVEREAANVRAGRPAR